MYTTTTVPAFLNLFAGRTGIGHDDIYVQTKRYKIADVNRDYVWPDVPGLQDGFINDVLKQDALPPIIICNDDLIDAGNRATTLWLFHNNKLVVGGLTFDTLPQDKRDNWSGCTMSMLIISGATEDEKAGYYEKFNKGVSLTFGQKLDNRRARPLVAMALSMIGRGGVFPLADLQNSVWTPRFKITKPRTELGRAYSVLSASMYGAHYFHDNYGLHSAHIMGPDVPNLANLNAIYTVIKSADQNEEINAALKKKVFNKFIGAVILDFHKMAYAEFTDKWSRFFRAAYTTLSPNEFKNLCKEASALRAASRGHPEFGITLGALSEVVRRYLATGAVADNAGDDDDEESVDTDE
jgi:hypothetical protein